MFAYTVAFSVNQLSGRGKFLVGKDLRTMLRHCSVQQSVGFVENLAFLFAETLANVGLVGSLSQFVGCFEGKNNEICT